ncbi:hypothetical protein KSS87_004688 [Heliosperma pusillum]|nr:hypothetical protein KSS87_021003 [Heliosperma pusillum]KAH9621113.1 hypothetical protein KSS87_004688 [Heliosperma pusillum]
MVVQVVDHWAVLMGGGPWLNGWCAVVRGWCVIKVVVGGGGSGGECERWGSARGHCREISRVSLWAWRSA